MGGSDENGMEVLNLSPLFFFYFQGFPRISKLPQTPKIRLGVWKCLEILGNSWESLEMKKTRGVDLIFPSHVHQIRPKERRQYPPPSKQTPFFRYFRPPSATAPYFSSRPKWALFTRPGESFLGRTGGILRGGFAENLTGSGEI